MKMVIFTLFCHLVASEAVERAARNFQLARLLGGKKIKSTHQTSVCAVVWLFGFQLRCVNRCEHAACGPLNNKGRRADLNIALI